MADTPPPTPVSYGMWGAPNTWVSLIAGLSVLVQSIFGVIAFVFTLTQTTNINAFNYTVTYTAIQGAVLLVLLFMSLFWVQTLREYRARIWTFLSWFIFTYTVIVVWLWHYRHHNHTNSTPVPLTGPFVSYLCANIFVVFASAFFVVLGWGVWTMRPDTQSETRKIEALGREFNQARTAFLVMGIIMFVFGILEGIWGWLFVVGYSFGPLWVPLMFFCAFSVFDIIQFVLFVWFNIARARIVAPEPVGSGADEFSARSGAMVSFFTRHWDELWAAELFLAMFWVINFGAWVNLWQITGVQYTQFPSFDPLNMPLEYWSVFANSVFNTIFAPMLVYYFVTFWCYNADVVEDMAPRATFTVGTGDVSYWGFVPPWEWREPIEGTSTFESVSFTSKKGITRVLLLIFFLCFILYQLVAGGFILNEILQSTYLATHFYVWYILADVLLSLVFVIFVIYAATTYTGLYSRKSARGEMTISGTNSVNVCTFGRPILTLLFIAFMTMFAYSTLYSRYHNGVKQLVGTADPLSHTNSIYYGSLLGILGFLFISVFFVAKDGMMSINNTTFVYNPKAGTALSRSSEVGGGSGVGGKEHRPHHLTSSHEM